MVRESESRPGYSLSIKFAEDDSVRLHELAAACFSSFSSVPLGTNVLISDHRVPGKTKHFSVTKSPEGSLNPIIIIYLFYFVSVSLRV